MNATSLKNAFHKLPPVVYTSTWDLHRKALRNHVRKDNIARFLRWEVIHATMFVGEAPYIELELDDLLADKSLVWGTALHESNVGDPPRLSYCEWTSGNKVVQCYHLQQLAKRIPIEPSAWHMVFEFGGGYGSMCHVIHRLGFKGIYSLADLPEFLLLQEYYLSQLGIDPNIVHTPPHAMAVDLFIALFSFSEVPIELRERYLQNVEAESYLFAYQPQWGEFDNIKWFKSIQDRLPNYYWWDFECQYKNEYRYLIGIKKTKLKEIR